METFVIHGVTLNKEIVEAIGMIQDLNAGNWSDETLDKVLWTYFNGGPDATLSEGDTLKQCASIHNMKSLLQKIRPVEVEPSKKQKS